MDFKSYSTYKEITMQPESWATALIDIVNDNVFNTEILKTIYDQVIFFGCGSSYNLGQSASVFYRHLTENTCSIALPSSELLIRPELYINKTKKYLLIGFSRSGETTESVRVLEEMKDKKNITTLAFTCRDGSSFLKISTNNFLCRNAVEKSIVMTTSFSSMLIAFCLTLAVACGKKEIISNLKGIIEFIKLKMPYITDFIDNFVKKVDFNSYFALGNGFNYGLAVEADLKMKEMSQIPSYSYHIHEFSHGPKSLLNDNSLCVVLTPAESALNYKQPLKEFVELGSNMLIIGTRPDLFIEDGVFSDKVKIFLDENLSFINSPENEIMKSFINIPVFQMLAFFKTLKNNLNPDMPNNLSYTVKL